MNTAAALPRAAIVTLLIALAPVTASLQSSREAVVGTWRGTSLCTNRQALPACGDEQVVYDIAAVPGKPDAITVKADKIVDGRRQFMGEMTFDLDAKTGRWVAEIKTPNVHALWYLSLSGGALSGGMTLLPLTTQVRAIALRRPQGSV
jgi:hypothetical protein